VEGEAEAVPQQPLAELQTQALGVDDGLAFVGHR
jgi:hypothetical protein